MAKGWPWPDCRREVGRGLGAETPMIAWLDALGKADPAADFLVFSGEGAAVDRSRSNRSLSCRDLVSRRDTSAEGVVYCKLCLVIDVRSFAIQPPR